VVAYQHGTQAYISDCEVSWCLLSEICMVVITNWLTRHNISVFHRWPKICLPCHKSFNPVTRLWLITRFCLWVKHRMPLMQQELCSGTTEFSSDFWFGFVLLFNSVVCLIFVNYACPCHFTMLLSFSIDLWHLIRFWDLLTFHLGKKTKCNSPSIKYNGLLIKVAIDGSLQVKF
jgi:hypothetical protein